MSVSRRDRIFSTTTELVAQFLYYDRNDDDDMPRGEIEDAISAGEISIDEIVDHFRETLFINVP